MEQERQREYESLTQPELSLPRFDDEATVLSARPVVALTEIKKEARLRRYLALGLVVFGMILGVTIYIAFIKPEQKENLVGEVATPTSEQPLHDALQRSEAPESAAGNDVATSDKKDLDKSVALKLNEPRVSSDSSHVGRPTRQVAGQSLSSERNGTEDSRKVEQNPRRLRRREERAAGRQKARDSDGLLRIQEIFEGQPRP